MRGRRLPGRVGRREGSQVCHKEEESIVDVIIIYPSFILSFFSFILLDTLNIY